MHDQVPQDQRLQSHVYVTREVSLPTSNPQRPSNTVTKSSARILRLVTLWGSWL